MSVDATKSEEEPEVSTDYDRTKATEYTLGDFKDGIKSLVAGDHIHVSVSWLDEAVNKTRTAKFHADVDRWTSNGQVALRTRSERPGKPPVGGEWLLSKHGTLQTSGSKASFSLEHLRVWRANTSDAFDVRVDRGRFYSHVASVAAVTDRAELTISGDGIKLTGVNPPKVATIEAEIQVETPTDSRYVVGVDPRELVDTLAKRPGARDVVLRVDDDEGRLVVTMYDEQFVVEMFDAERVDDHADPEPEGDQYGYVTAPTAPALGTLMAACTSARATEEKTNVMVEITSDGLSTTAADYSDTPWFEISGDHSGADPVTAVYSPDYLSGLLQELPAPAVSENASEISVGVGDDSPLVIEVDGIRYLQAPRLVDEQDGGDD